MIVLLGGMIFYERSRKHWAFTLLLVFLGCYQALGASSFVSANSVSLHLNSFTRECNFTEASLFCRDQTDFKVCHHCVNGSAVCNKIPDASMICRKGLVYIRDCYCATYSSQSNSIHFGKCLYNCGRNKVDSIDDGYRRLPQNISELNKRMCGILHHNKTLCGRCEDMHYPMAFSYNLTCVQCQHDGWNWLKLVLFVFGPLTVFCFVILIFNINITSSYLHGCIFFSEGLSVPAMQRAILIAAGKSTYLVFMNIINSFYSIWNFDILRSFSPTLCLHVDPLDIMLLDLLIGLYPLLLVLISHFMISLYDKKFRIIRILWEPFRRLLSWFHNRFKIKTSIIDSFATVFVLSNVKFMSVCFDMLASVKVYELSSSKTIHHKFSLFYDATTYIYSSAARAAITHLVLIVFTILPILLLLLYPFKFFQKLLNIIPIQWHILHTFVDVYQGGYKNGSIKQQWDLRWFSSFFFIIRLLFIVIYVLTLSSVFFGYIVILSVLTALLLIILQPFKREQDAYVNSGFFLLLSLGFTSILGIEVAQNTNVNFILFFYGLCAAVAVLPLAFLFILLMLWIKTHI